MNFQGQVVLVYLEEDNIARAYFRIKPLMTQEGPVGDTKADYPDDGYLRIVPDRNEQHTFKERMRGMCGLCMMDLRDLPPEANKIRTNKNYAPARGETNQYIIYSDAVRALPDSLVFQVVPEGGLPTASTAQVYIRNGANIQGPFDRESGQPVGETAQLPPDSGEIHSVTVNGQDLLFYWPKTASAPAQSAPAPEEKPENAEEKKEAPAPAAPKEEKADPQKNAYEQIQAMNVAPSATANRLHDASSAAVMDFAPEQPQRPLTGTRLYQTPQKQVSPRRAHNSLMEVVDRERYAARYEAPGATLPQSAELKEVANPADALKRALTGMWQSLESQKQAVDVVLAHPGMRVMLAKAVAHEANDLTVAAMHSQLQELEAERLMTLMQLDDAKKNLAAAREEALNKLTAEEQKKLDRLTAAQQTAQEALEELRKEIEPLRKQADESIETLQSDLCASYRLIQPALGQDADQDALISRVDAAMKAAGFLMEEGDALAILTAYALSGGEWTFCAAAEEDARLAFSAFAAALGVPFIELGAADPVILPGGDAPVLINGLPSAAHPLLSGCSYESLDALEQDSFSPAFPCVPFTADLTALPGKLPAYPPVSKQAVIRAMVREGDLSEDTKAVIASLRKSLSEAGRPLPLEAVGQMCRFIVCTQNSLKGGVAEAIDRAVCLYAASYLQDMEDLKPLLAAMPRTLRVLNA